MRSPFVINVDLPTPASTCVHLRWISRGRLRWFLGLDFPHWPSNRIFPMRGESGVNSSQGLASSIRLPWERGLPTGSGLHLNPCHQEFIDSKTSSKSRPTTNRRQIDPKDITHVRKPAPSSRRMSRLRAIHHEHKTSTQLMSRMKSVVLPNPPFGAQKSSKFVLETDPT